MIWRDLKSRKALVPEKEHLSIQLTINLSDGQAEKLFPEGVVGIGRDPDSDIFIDEPTISWNHARIEFLQGHWWFEDLESTNGSFVNELPVEAVQVLTEGDVIKCGNMKMKFHILD
jgi:pSer/pThr/pTyr-binding forkhead associated (FHA) protein